LRFKDEINIKSLLKAVIFAFVFVIGIITLKYMNSYINNKIETEKFKISKKQGPIGIPVGKVTGAGSPVFLTSPYAMAELPSPQRVLSVHDSRATDWDHSTGYHWEYIHQDIVDTMVAYGVIYLVGLQNLKNEKKKSVCNY
jgi:hypothetical protein